METQYFSILFLFHLLTLYTQEQGNLVSHRTCLVLNSLQNFHKSPNTTTLSESIMSNAKHSRYKQPNNGYTTSVHLGPVYFSKVCPI